MNPAVLLIDLQNDFLNSPSLEPAAGQIVARAARLLEGARTAGVPVIHVWTTVHRNRNDRMPHWKEVDRWICVEGESGHETPASLLPREGERVIHKTFFSAFSTGELGEILKSLKADTLILAGVHLHGCVRSTALDAYQFRLAVWVAEDAVGSDDPSHASVSQRWLSARAARFASAESCLAFAAEKVSKAKELWAPPLWAGFIHGKVVSNKQLRHSMHCSPCDEKNAVWQFSIAGNQEIFDAVNAARRAQEQWRATLASTRAGVLLRLADLLAEEERILVRIMVPDVGKPIAFVKAEVARSIALLKATASRAGEVLEARCGENSTSRNVPIGVIAMITPWNNPLAIPVGKIAPALLYGNAIIWKPAPAGSAIALELIQLLHRAGCPPGVANLICGDRSTALSLMSDSGVDAVTITGSPQAGYAAQDICTRRHIPLQAELGGNNAAIVWSDADLKKAAVEISDAAFAFAGQRCTANRRAIVHAAVYDQFLKQIEEAATAMVWGDPADAATRIGPLISSDKCREVEEVLERAKRAGALVINPQSGKPHGAYFPPAIVCCDDPAQEIFQEETFAPVLVITKARDWDHAMQLCNGVRQGLVASLFSASSELHEQFLNTAQAGILKINRATADADAEAPFGGWKASGIGPPEHGASNREFYTRTQAVYR